MERETIKAIRESVRKSVIPTQFRAADVNKALGITWGGNFLAKHRVDKPGNDTKLFIRVSRGLYTLKQ